MIRAPSDPTQRDWPRHLHLRNRVELSPTPEKLKASVSLKGATDLSISLNPNYRMLICTITNIFTININNTHVTPRRVGVAWACVALPHGPKCHVASTWPRANKSPFLLYWKSFLTFKNRKLIQKNLEKSLKIRKFINFNI